MADRRVLNLNFDRCRGRFLNFGTNLKMVARKIQNVKFDRSRGRILNLGLNLKMIDRIIQNLTTAAAVELSIFNCGINLKKGSSQNSIFIIRPLPRSNFEF